MEANKPPNGQHRSLTEGPVSLHLSRLTGFMLLGFVAVMGANRLAAAGPRIPRLCVAYPRAPVALGWPWECRVLGSCSVVWGAGAALGRL